MNVESESMNYPPTEGAVPSANAADVEMVAVSDSSGAKTVRNVQTQHGDYRSVDAENIFLIARCLWPDDDDKNQAPLKATTSTDNSDGAGASTSDNVSDACADQQPESTEETEQVVWIEPFANQVCFHLSHRQNTKVH